MKNLTVKITGTSPLLLSADVLADPLNELTVAHKELTNKRKKTEEDHYAIAKSQWCGLLYWDDKMNVVLPTQNIRASIVGGAKLHKLGMPVKRATMMLDELVELNYGKKLTVEELWEQKFIDRRSVVISNKRVICYRPKFINWNATFTLSYDESTLDESNLKQSIDNAGKFIGIGGFRPEKGGVFGRFTAEYLN